MRPQPSPQHLLRRSLPALLPPPPVLAQSKWPPRLSQLVSALQASPQPSALKQRLPGRPSPALYPLRQSAAWRQQGPAADAKRWPVSAAVPQPPALPPVDCSPTEVRPPPSAPGAAAEQSSLARASPQPLAAPLLAVLLSLHSPLASALLRPEPQRQPLSLQDATLSRHWPPPQAAPCAQPEPDAFPGVGSRGSPSPRRLASTPATSQSSVWPQLRAVLPHYGCRRAPLKYACAHARLHPLRWSSNASSSPLRRLP